MSASKPPIPARFDPSTVRRAFTSGLRAGKTSAELYHAAAQRLREHLDPIRLVPERVLDVGTGHGAWAAELERTFPRAALFITDNVSSRLPKLPRPRLRLLRRRRHIHRAVMDATALAVAPDSIDLVTSNLMLHWVDDQPAWFRASAEVLRPEGLLLFSTLGADTLRELRQAWAEHDDQYVHVHPFADMHDMGDQLARAGFTDVVMDAERVILTYSEPRELLAELHRLEVGNLCARRTLGLTTPRRLSEVCESYRRLPGASDPDTGRIRATVELVFAHAWAGRRGTATRSLTTPERARSVEVAAPLPKPERSSR